MRRYLVDTNHLGLLINQRTDIRERFHRHVLAGRRFGTCVPALCELQAGLYRTARREVNLRRLAKLLEMIRIWPLPEALPNLYATLFHDLRAKGRGLSQVDLILASLALSVDATLLTSDRDFEAVTDLRIENWLE